MELAAHYRSPGRNAPGIATVVVLHVLLGWALVSGLARQVVDIVKAPLEARILPEVRKPPPDLPPPPPPPKLLAPPPPFIPPPEINVQVPATTPPPAITVASSTPPPATAPVRAAPPAPARPAVRHEYKSSHRVDPVYPRRALQSGVTGEVLAWVYVSPSGAVTRVEIRRSSNPIFNHEVIRALSQWTFNPEPTGFIGEYEISFHLKD